MSRSLVVIRKSTGRKVDDPNYSFKVANASANVEVYPYVEVLIPNSYFNKIDFRKFNNRTTVDAIKLVDRYKEKLVNNTDDISGDYFVASNYNLLEILNKIKEVSEKYINEKWALE